jgi:hypothetical protein
VNWFQIKIVVVAVLLAFVVVACWKRPRRQGGRLILKLCLANAGSWILILPFDVHGHPPPALIVGSLLWIFNLPVLVAAVAAIWVTFKGREESRAFLTASTCYVTLNIITLWIVPAVFLFLNL